MLPPQVPKFVLIKKVVDSKLFPPNADARGGISWFERTYIVLAMILGWMQH